MSDFVTDHAVLCYLERFKDVDVEAVREYIAEKTKPHLSNGASKVKTSYGAVFVVSNTGRVITTRHKDMERNRHTSYIKPDNPETNKPLYLKGKRVKHRKKKSW